MYYTSFNPSVEGQPLQLYSRPFTWVPQDKFQSLCRGTAIATSSRGRKDRSWWGFNPSVEGQPLQRIFSGRDDGDDESFNPSVEGQPLQHIFIRNASDREVEFQSLCRGTAIATRKLSEKCWRQSMTFQSLCRGTAIATESLQRPWFPIVTIGCFSNLWLVFVF